MSGSGDNALGQNIFELVQTDARLEQALSELQAKITRVPTNAAQDGTLSDAELDADCLKALMFTLLNGSSDLPEQRVQLEYLRNDQKMKIPLALAMVPFAINNPEVTPNAVLIERYWKVSTMSYADIYRAVSRNQAPPEVRKIVDDRDMPAIPDPPTLHPWPTTYVAERGVEHDAARAAISFAYISQCLQFNCDLRDMGKLALVNMRMADAAWKTSDEMPQDRFSVKLRPYTLQVTAALNMQACEGYAPAAWTRAYGLATGLLPARDSLLQKEYEYVAAIPPATIRKGVCDFESKLLTSFYPIAMNLLSMFGLLHLAKDHTYKTGDSNMERAGQAYLMAIRTMVPSVLMEDMRSHQELLVRTAQHPFGLGQTYALALHMASYNRLASPLALRVNATPPPVQRIFVITACKDEWTVMPIGQIMTRVFGDSLRDVEAACTTVTNEPPAYSGLHELYGIDEMRKVEDRPFKAATSLMPIVYGYSMVQHTDDDQKKEGIALSMGLQNVAAQHKVVTAQWRKMWEDYIDRVDSEGLEAFLRTAQRAIQEGTRQ